MMLNLIHNDIVENLNHMIQDNNIPNILFHGPSGAGKHVLVTQFIRRLYKTYQDERMHVLYANCEHGKGIKFIREELKFFAKTQQSLHHPFKSILLTNVDSLTNDAQSALRRCIEQFSRSTRFFIIANDKTKLLKPILSRFCEIYIPLPSINLHVYQVNSSFGKEPSPSKRIEWIRNHIMHLDIKDPNSFIQLTNKLYDKGYSGKDLLAYISKSTTISTKRKTHILIQYHSNKHLFKHEPLFMLFILYQYICNCDEILKINSYI